MVTPLIAFTGVEPAAAKMSSPTLEGFACVYPTLDIDAGARGS